MTLLLRAKVARAAHDIVPTWPLDSFIAVNPLADGERRPFDHAHQHGAATTRPQGAYIADFRSGRIQAADLIAAVTERIPELADADEVAVSDLGMTGAELVALELELQQSAPPHRPRLEPKLDRVDQITAKWVAAFLDPEPLWPMPGRTNGLYSAWRRMARHDLDLPRRARRELRSLAERADDALGDALAGLGISEDDSELVMRAELARLPGWVSHIKWRSEHVGDIDLTAYLALRLSLRRALHDHVDPWASVTPHDIGAPEPLRSRAERLVRHVVGTRMLGREEVGAVARMLALHPEREHPLTWQRAYELHYRDELLSSIDGVAEPIEHATVQLVMCIDPRSEGMRRQLERSASIETVGFAGFFGVPIRFVRYRARGAVNSLPALLAPRHTVTESPSDRAHASRRTRALRVRDAVASGLHAGDRVAAAPFALAETAGWFLGIWAAFRTVAPGLAARIALRLDALTAPSVSAEVTVADAFTLDERAGMAETAMRMMGLTRCAPLVVLAGHGSTTMNNLYESSLECGACGGNPGAPNARAAAAIFNDPDVREVLGRRGIDIPHSTFFVAAEHNTISDLVTALDPHLVPQTHHAALADFEILQREAARRLVRERAADLPGASARRGAAPVRRRAHDWAEVYPELGLAGNAAMIIGPRELTRGVDLKRRVFLHSYRTEFDPDGRALETILTAPVVVAQWINHQYYFSALGPDQLGAGTKTIHNAIGTLGVLSGQDGDLRRGLPWQSVGFGAELFHEPLRLAVVVQAPLARIGEIVSRNQVLRDLFDNGWITLTARPEPGTPWRRYAQYGWAALPERTSTPEGAFP